MFISIQGLQSFLARVPNAVGPCTPHSVPEDKATTANPAKSPNFLFFQCYEGSYRDFVECGRISSLSMPASACLYRSSYPSLVFKKFCLQSTSANFCLYLLCPTRLFVVDVLSFYLLFFCYSHEVLYFIEHRARPFLGKRSASCVLE